MSSTPALPLFGIEYAPPKCGKTTQSVMSFPNATFIGEFGAIKPLEETTGWLVKDIRPAKTVKDAVKILVDIAAKKKQKFLVVDDLSLLVENSVIALEKQFGIDGRALYSELFKDIVMLRDRAIESGVHVWMNAHLQPPQTKDGVFIHGGPKLPGKNPASIAAKVQTIVKTEVNPAKKTGWPMVYRASPLDKQYFSGDRWGMVFDMAPQNVGELMRERGFVVPRAVGLEWQEDIAESFALDAMAIPVKEQVKGMAELLKSYMSLLSDYDPRHAYWAIRDGQDRAIIRKRKQNQLAFLLGVGV